MRGRVGALIALGAGFNPILTGRENIYVNALVLGLSKKEITDKIDEIIDFAEIGEFIDSPVQSYSSGMQVRLGFAVATTLNPDVLILDEVLAVGDAAFRSKCYHRIGKIQKDAAVIFVSHTVEQVARICSQVLLLRRGSSAFFGDTPTGCQRYSKEHESASLSREQFVQIRDPVVAGDCKWRSDKVEYGDSLLFTLRLVVSQQMENASVRHAFYSLSGEAVAEWTSVYAGKRIDLAKGENIIEERVRSVQLKPGLYEISTFVSDNKGLIVNYWAHKTATVVVEGTTYGICYYQMR